MEIDDEVGAANGKEEEVAGPFSERDISDDTSLDYFF
jgi:hypothetical protein